MAYGANRLDSFWQDSLTLKNTFWGRVGWAGAGGFVASLYWYVGKTNWAGWCLWGVCFVDLNNTNPYGRLWVVCKALNRFLIRNVHISLPTLTDDHSLNPGYVITNRSD